MQLVDAASPRSIHPSVIALRAANPALAAHRLAPTAAAHGSLLSTFSTPYATQLIGHTGSVCAAVFSPMSAHW